jgi:Reverse transcriptase (RNA-dependent DNA polymerase)
VDGKDVVLELPNGHQHFNVAMVKPSMTQTTEIRWTEVLQPKDPRRVSENMTSAIRAELMGLIERGTFKLVELADASDKNDIPIKFFLSIKHEDGAEKFKARFRLGGHRDFMKKSMMHTATQLSYSFNRLILAVAAVLGFDVWSTDVNQAYLQSACRLKRELFIQPKELVLGKNEFLLLLLQLYGLAESGDYWGETITDHHLLELQFEQSPINLAMFFKRLGKKLLGILGAYVDDLLREAPAEYWQSMEQSLCDSFDCKESLSHA